MPRLSLMLLIIQIKSQRGHSSSHAAAFVVTVLLGAVLVVRSQRHPAAIVDPAVLRVPTLWLSCLAMLVFSAAFAALVLGNVLFLTNVWHDSTVVAGLSMAPGPAVVVVVALVGSRLVQRIGPGAAAALGSLAFGLGVVVWLLRIGPEHAYATTMLPGMLLTGLGVGLILPSLTGWSGRCCRRRDGVRDRRWSTRRARSGWCWGRRWSSRSTTRRADRPR